MIVRSPAPQNDDAREERDEAHWAKVAENEAKLLAARERHRRRMEGYGSDSN